MRFKNINRRYFMLIGSGFEQAFNQVRMSGDWHDLLPVSYPYNQV